MQDPRWGRGSVKTDLGTGTSLCFCEVASWPHSSAPGGSAGCRGQSRARRYQRDGWEKWIPGGAEDLSRLISDNVFPMGADPPSLQGRMCCWHGASGGRHGSWQFSFGGQIGLLFDPNTRKWTEVHPGASWNKTTWENDRQLTDKLSRVSIGDCTRWLGKFLLPWKVMLETTARPPTTLGVVASKATATMPMPWAFLLLLTSSVLLVVQGEPF
uniref:MHC class I-like antigen recognition-like domain-containing protein n=1 Tax=Oryctolagus cuniculus TaxID=9986 RepID=G1U0K1_RABIT